MARSFYDVQFAQDQAITDELVRKILISANYREIQYGNEVVWKMGTGLMTAMHYIKIEYEGNILHIAGWVQIGVGSVGGKERDLTGFVGAIPKQSVVSTINRIRHNLVQAGGKIPAAPALTFPAGFAGQASAAAPAPAAPVYTPAQPQGAVQPEAYTPPAPAAPVYTPPVEQTFVFCPNCGSKLQIPAGQRLLVTCPSCEHSFEYQS